MFESEHLTGKPPCYIHTSINLIYHEFISALSPLITEIQPFQKEWLIKMWYEWKKTIHGKLQDKVLLCFITAIHSTSLI